MSTTTTCSKRFASTKKLMESKGIPVSRWIDGVLEDKDNIDQPDNLRAMVFWGHAPNSQTRGVEMKKAMEKLDLLVVIDPVSNGDRGPCTTARTVPTCCRRRRRSRLRFGHRVQPLAAVA